MWSARGLTGAEPVTVISRGVQLSATATYDHELKWTVLNDADNVPYAPICEMMGEVGKYGMPTYKRIYCDFISNRLQGWGHADEARHVKQ